MNPTRIVLVGGGHAHIEVVRQFQCLLPGDSAKAASVEMILVNPEPVAVYSGMIPGVVAGHYRPEDCLINLPALCNSCGVSWYQGQLLDMNSDNRTILLAGGERLSYDYLSLDIGSIPATRGIEGAGHSTTVKPANAFLQCWEQFLQQIETDRSRSICVVGGGVAGVELVLAMAHRIRAMADTTGWRWHLVSGSEILKGHNALARWRARKALESAGVQCITAVSYTHLTLPTKRIV